MAFWRAPDDARYRTCTVAALNLSGGAAHLWLRRSQTRSSPRRPRSRRVAAAHAAHPTPARAEPRRVHSWPARRRRERSTRQRREAPLGAADDSKRHDAFACYRDDVVEPPCRCRGDALPKWRHDAAPQLCADGAIDQRAKTCSGRTAQSRSSPLPPPSGFPRRTPSTAPRMTTTTTSTTQRRRRWRQRRTPSRLLLESELRQGGRRRGAADPQDRRAQPVGFEARSPIRPSPTLARTRRATAFRPRSRTSSISRTSPRAARRSPTGRNTSTPRPWPTASLAATFRFSSLLPHRRRQPVPAARDKQQQQPLLDDGCEPRSDMGGSRGRRCGSFSSSRPGRRWRRRASSSAAHSTGTRFGGHTRPPTLRHPRGGVLRLAAQEPQVVEREPAAEHDGAAAAVAGEHQRHAAAAQATHGIVRGMITWHDTWGPRRVLAATASRCRTASRTRLPRRRWRRSRWAHCRTRGLIDHQFRNWCATTG